MGHITLCPEIGCSVTLLEAPPGFEPGIKVLQTYALPLGYSAIPLYIVYSMSKKTFCAAYAVGADYEARTRYLHLGKVALYQMS